MPLQVADIEHLPELAQPLSQPSMIWSQALALGQQHMAEQAPCTTLPLTGLPV